LSFLGNGVQLPLYITPKRLVLYPSCKRIINTAWVRLSSHKAMLLTVYVLIVPMTKY